MPASWWGVVLVGLGGFYSYRSSEWALTARARSRSAGTAIVKAVDKVIAKARRSRRNPDGGRGSRHRVQDGAFVVKGTDKKKAFAEVSLAAYVPHNYPLDKLEPGLNENAFYDRQLHLPAGSHICEVEVDPDTGNVQDRELPPRSTTSARSINPDDRRWAGSRRAHPGDRPGAHRRLPLRRGFGPARHGSYLDYCCRARTTLPAFKVGTKETPCTHNPSG